MNLFDLFAKISLDTRDYEKGIEKAKKSAQEYKSDVMKLAQTYKKQGMNMSDAMTKAYQEIDKSQYETAETSEKTSKKFSLNWDNAGEKLEKTASKIGSALVTTTKATFSIGNTAANVFAGLVTTASGGIAALGKVGIEYNSQIESYVTNFTTMLGDAEKAAIKVDEIKTMAAKTPFGLADLASATQTLLAFGIESDKTTGIMQQLGDISLGNAERFQSLTLAFSQAASAGKLAGQDLLQMINAGFNPLSQLVDETGLSVGQLKELMGGLSKSAEKEMLKTSGLTDYGRKLIEQGYISADDLAYSLDVATRKGGQFYEGMASASKTVTGLFSTLQDDAAALAGKVFEPANDVLKNKLLPSAMKYVATLSEAYGEGGEGALGRLIDSSSDIFAEIVVEATEQAPNLVKTTTNTVKKVISAVKSRKNELRTAGTTLFDELTGAFEETMDEAIPLIQEFVPDIADGFIEYGGLMFKTGGQIVMAVVNGLSSKSGEISEKLVSTVEGALTFVDLNAEDLATGALNIGTALVTALGDNLPDFAETGVLIIGKIGTALVSNADKIGEGLNAVLDGGLDAAGTVVTSENVQAFIEAGAKMIDSLTDAIWTTENQQKIGDTAAKVAIEFAEGVVKSIPSLWELGKGFYEKFEFGHQLIEDGKEMFVDAMSGVDAILGPLIEVGDVARETGNMVNAGSEELAEESYITTTPKSEGTGETHIGGDTFNINVYAQTDDALTLAEQVATEIERMKERRMAAGG